MKSNSCVCDCTMECDSVMCSCNAELHLEVLCLALYFVFLCLTTIEIMLCNGYSHQGSS